MTAITLPTPENVAGILATDDNGFHDGSGWYTRISADGAVVSIEVEPLDKDGNPADKAHFRAVVVEGETAPVLLAGSAYVSGSGDGYLYLRCAACKEICACIDAGSSLAGLNAEVAEHTCPTPPAATSGEAETR